MLRIQVSTLALGAALFAAAPALADTPAAAPDSAAPAPATDAAADAGQSIVVTGRQTRSVATLQSVEIQKLLPGINPLKAIETLPGVLYLTADPWGNNEQNIQLFIHGFNAQQLGYTLDGVPLGDQQYGNFNGLSPQRAIISENVGSVTLASGAGDLGTASTSNLGGTIDTLSSDPKATRGATLNQTFGSYDALRTYARIDSGTFGNGNSFYVSGVRQDARAWDFDGHQKGIQGDFKFVHDDDRGKFTLYAGYSDKAEPNEDATVITVNPATGVDNRGIAPYTRPFLYPDFPAAQAYYKSPEYAAVAATNYRNYYGDAQRTDYIFYGKYDWHLSDRVRWTNTLYYHHDDGVGVIAGPITAAGLPLLFSYYYPNPAGGSPTSAANIARLSGIFGNSGLAERTTEYRIDRGGVISTLRLNLGNHDLELGGWYEHLSHSGYRRWYAFDVNNPTSPYTRPGEYESPLITQYGSQVRADEYQTHIQDAWHIRPNVTLLAGFKSTFQDARQRVAVQPIPGSFTGSRELPNGRIYTPKPFLPQIGANWDVNGHEQVFANAQRNIRQFQTSATAGLSPFALGSQSLFDVFKANTRPETSWTYEGGIRTRRALDLGPITGFEGQVSYYHVDFKNRLLAISPTTTISATVSGATIIQNVGGVKTDGVDAAGTLHFGPHLSVYDALSYNNSRFNDNYLNGAALVPTQGKKVPGSPQWLNKFVVAANAGILDGQIVGDYVGRRYATFTNDLSVKSYMTLAAQVGVTVPLPDTAFVKRLRFSLNVTNLTDKKAQTTLSIGAAATTYNYFPLPPRQVFGTVSLGF